MCVCVGVSASVLDTQLLTCIDSMKEMFHHQFAISMNLNLYLGISTGQSEILSVKTHFFFFAKIEGVYAVCSIRSVMSSWVPVHILTNPCFIFGTRTQLSCRHFSSLTRCFVNSFASKRHASFTAAVSHNRIRAWKPDVDTVVSDNVKYGGKQIISVTPRLYDYILGNVREPEVIS